MKHPFILLIFIVLFKINLAQNPIPNQPVFSSTEIFPLQNEYVHGPTIVELANGDLLAGWFQRSGERWADDVRISGARLKEGQTSWSEPFLLADVPDFPDINPMMFVDGLDRLWLMWYTVLANQWETSLLKYRISKDYQDKMGEPHWDWQEVLHVKPGDKTERGIQPNDKFVVTLKRKIDEYIEYLISNGFLGENQEIIDQNKKVWYTRAERILSLAKGENMLRRGQLYKSDGTIQDKQLGYPHFRRLGWQTKNKPFILNNSRIIVPLYSDGFGFSLMAISDDWGSTWKFSEPIVGGGNIQGSIARKKNGSLVVFMRDNGPPPKRLQYAVSQDSGFCWSTVNDSQLPNPGSGADIVTLRNGNWCIVYNDTERGRQSLAVSLSEDEGETWRWIRHLELDTREEHATSSHYPAVIQGKDQMIHVVYSFHHQDRGGGPNKTIKYAEFNEIWVKEGD
jgi:predicted neuraminidase